MTDREILDAILAGGVQNASWQKIYDPNDRCEDLIEMHIHTPQGHVMTFDNKGDLWSVL